LNDSLNPQTNKTLAKLSNSVPLSIGVQASGTIYIKKEFKHGETTKRQDGHSHLFNLAAWAQIAQGF
jgi:hypothetical protein